MQQIYTVVGSFRLNKKTASTRDQSSKTAILHVNVGLWKFNLICNSGFEVVSMFS